MGYPVYKTTRKMGKAHSSCSPTHLQDLSVLRRVGVPLRLADDLAGDAHPVEHGHVEHGGHGRSVERLRAVGPEVGALRRVDVAGVEGGLDGKGKKSRGSDLICSIS